MSKAIALILLLFQAGNIFSQQTVGLFANNAGSQNGYVLFAPIHSDTTYLIDKCGKQVNKWYSHNTPGLSVYLLADASLLHTGAKPNAVFNTNGSAGGVIQRYDWNNNLLWSFTISDSLQTQDHDVCQLPNGNILVAVWEKINAATALASGRNPTLLGTELWSAKIMELQPLGTNQANIVWQWRLWDHLIQDFDSTRANYGIVADHPELVNLNYANNNNRDWIHLNAITYNATLDQVMISAHALSEIWILDHSTSTGQAAGHSGGSHAKGGDLLYRWGNPAAYNRGTVSDQTLFVQHNPNWIPANYKDGNNIAIFNNGTGRPTGNYSTVDIITPPVDSNGNYSLVAGQPFGPVSAYWSYAASVPTDFYSNNMGSAQRLSNGNTLICEAQKGNFFEIDSGKNIVWRYVNPVNDSGIIPQDVLASQNMAFRCTLFEPTYSGFSGLTLAPGSPIQTDSLSASCTTVTEITGVSKEPEIQLKVINPFYNRITVASNADIENATVSLYDMRGREIRVWFNQNFYREEANDLAVPELASGLYLLHINSVHFNHTLKLIHQQ